MNEHNKVQLAVVVNGQLTLVEANLNAPLLTVVPKALEQTGNTGQPADNWELRDASGQILDLHKKIEDYQFPPDVKLFLNLKAGVGGSVATDQFVDPEVTRAKFDREIAQFRELEPDYRRRGWVLLDATFPDVHIMLAATQLKPPAIVTGVHVNYANYDVVPPSVQLVDPFTFKPYTAQELPVALNKRVAMGAVANGQEAPNFHLVGAQPLMQHYGPDTIPFLCVAGVREYHQHPAHSGDAWELHRTAGAGKLARILDLVYRYGVEPIAQYNVGLIPQITGFAFSQVPE